MTPRRTLILWGLALVAFHAVASAWQPILGDDWFSLLWNREHDAGWLATHHTANLLWPYVFTHARAAFVIVNAAAALALVVGIFVVAHRRLPRDTWRDTLGVIAVSAMIWVAQSRPGFVFFYRSNAATQVVGCAVAVWLFAAFVTEWRPRGAVLPGLLVVIAGLVVGTSSHQLAVGTTVGVAILLRRTPAGARPRWMWLALVALIAGTALALATPPFNAIMRVVSRSFELNLGLLDGPVRATGKLVTGVLLLALARLTISTDTAAELPAPRTTRAWIIAWLALTVLALTGPRFTEATVFPATIALVIGIAPYAAWLCELRAIRTVVIGLIAILHVVFWTRGLLEYAQIHREFEDRMARLHAAPPGTVATISPYTQIGPDDWFFGEDWTPATRQLAAIEIFGLRDIAFDSRLIRLEDNPGIALHLESTGLTDAERAKFVPAIWAGDPITAKNQFETLVRRLRHAGATGFTAHLVVDNVPFAERRARRLEIAWYEHGELVTARPSHTPVDENDLIHVRLAVKVVAAFPEAYLVRGDQAAPVIYRDGGYPLRAMDNQRYAVVACSTARCVLVDALIPRL